MKKFFSSSCKQFKSQQLVSPNVDIIGSPPSKIDVFINHRGIDTKRHLSGLLYNRLKTLGLNPFLDTKNMKPGDKLFHHIDSSLRRSKLAIAVFSPRYCESVFCLHELALIMERKMKFIPIFCDVKPSELKVLDIDGTIDAKDFQRYQCALAEAKFTVGLTFDSSTTDWSQFLVEATDSVMKNLLEAKIEEERRRTKVKETSLISLFKKTKVHGHGVLAAS